MIVLENVSKEYKNGVHALRNVNLTIEDAEFVYVIGPTGSGKSTLIKLLDGEEIPSSGRVLVDDVDVGKLKHAKVPIYRRNIGVVFQDFRLLPSMTVFENIAFAMECVGESKVNIRKRVREVLELVSLSDKAKAFPSELSGGEQQRVSVARALAKKPKVLFLDEPTGALDELTGRQVLDYICKLKKQYGFTIVMVTHNSNIAEMAKTVIKMNSGKISGTYQNEVQKSAYEIGW